MPAKVTKFQRPDPETEYEELLPITIVPGNPMKIIDPNDPPIVGRAVYCCECVNGSITLCVPEQTTGWFVTLAPAQGISYYLQK